jgi:hypothetical protein
MATRAEVPKTSHCVRRVLQNSTAFAESNPRVAVSREYDTQSDQAYVTHNCPNTAEVQSLA